MQISVNIKNSKFVTATMSPVIEKSFYFKIRLKKYFLSMLTALLSPWGIQNLFQKMSNPDFISTVRYCMCVGKCCRCALSAESGNYPANLLNRWRSSSWACRYFPFVAATLRSKVINYFYFSLKFHSFLGSSFRSTQKEWNEILVPFTSYAVFVIAREKIFGGTNQSSMPMTQNSMEA